MGGWAFQQAGDGLTKLTFPSSVQRIDDYAFYKCRGLEQVTWPAELRHVGAYAFGDCKYLGYGKRYLRMPSKLQSVGRWAFSGTHLPPIVVPASVRSVGEFGFSNPVYLLSADTLSVFKDEISRGVQVAVVKKLTASDFSWSWKSRAYSGKSQHPTLALRGATLKKYAGYTLHFPKSSAKVGRYYVTASYPRGIRATARVGSYTIVPKSVRLTKLTAKRSSKQLTATWSRLTSQCSGYQLQISSTSEFSKSRTITKKYSVTRGKVTFGGCKKGKTYHFRIRAYKKAADGKTYYGAWSPVRKIRY